jgi:glycosyltransferase involved in cell wall biosynthesis
MQPSVRGCLERAASGFTTENGRQACEEVCQRGIEERADVVVRRESELGRTQRTLCMVVHGPYPLDPRVVREARVALRQGYEVDIVATRQPGEPAEEYVEGVRVIRLPVAHTMGGGAGRIISEYAAFSLLACVRLARLALKRRYAIVHVHNPPDFLVAAALIPRLLGCRVIFDIHDLSPDMFNMRFDGRRGADVADRLLKGLERWATRIADGVITVHDAYARELVKRGVPPEKLIIVMNSVDEEFLPAAVRASDEGFRVVYHGTVTPHYGLELVVEAVARLSSRVPGIRLDVYGAGDAVAAARHRASALGIPDRVRFTGRFLPHAEVLERVRSANVGVIPNLPIELNRFALSSKLFEYVALGVPVVSADLPTIREHFADDEVRFFYETYRWPRNAARYAELLARITSRASRGGV